MFHFTKFSLPGMLLMLFFLGVIFYYIFRCDFLLHLSYVITFVDLFLYLPYGPVVIGLVAVVPSHK